jgi:hypothetical protein
LEDPAIAWPANDLLAISQLSHLLHFSTKPTVSKLRQTFLRAATQGYSNPTWLYSHGRDSTVRPWDGGGGWDWPAPGIQHSYLAIFTWKGLHCPSMGWWERVGLASTRYTAILPGYIHMEGTPLPIHGMVGEGGTGQLQRPLILLVAVHSYVSQQPLVAPSKSAMKTSCHK